MSPMNRHHVGCMAKPPRGGWYVPKYQKHLYTIPMKKIKVIEVDGYEVRSFLDVGFIGAGHPVRCPYIPKGVMWVEKGFRIEDQRAFIEGHEVPEMETMDLIGCDETAYDKAHIKAEKSESKYRQDNDGVPAPVITD